MNWTVLVQLALQILPTLLQQSPSWLGSAAGAVIAYDHDTVKWLQGALNSLLNLSPPLVVDGIFGPKTRAAVAQAETHFGLPANGTIGRALILAVEEALKLVPKT